MFSDPPAFAAHASRIVHLNATITVQTEPLMADEWSQLLTPAGWLCTVVALTHEEFSDAIAAGRRNEDPVGALLATKQAAHTSPCWMVWRVVGADTEWVFVEVTNDLREWAYDNHNVEAYNSEVGPASRLTPELLAQLRA